MIITDRELLRSLQAGDSEAMVMLFDRYSPIVYTVALSILKSPESAEMVLQDLFIRLWHHPDSAHADCGSLYGWILTASRNEAINLLRSH